MLLRQSLMPCPRRGGARPPCPLLTSGGEPRPERLDVLVLDDFALSPLPEHGRRDLLEILEDRTGTRGTIVTSQLPPGKWHDYVADPTLADALCDRLLHPAHRLALKGPSRRKEASPDS